ncbi:hypothetical protein HDU76_002084 [Blyttiomyces sp. JEL0837]|nr:hypothetical protein HDU76_002084 [Blyttiomyces sp. JEL0837]
MKRRRPNPIQHIIKKNNNKQPIDESQNTDADLANLLARASYTSPLPVCTAPSTDPTATYNKIKAPSRNLFGNFNTTSQSDSISTYLLSQKALNLTAYDKASVNTNYIWLIEPIPVNKSLALSYLDANDTTRAKMTIPDSYANVVVYAGGLKVPVIKEYRVGPLPVSAKTKVVQVNADRYLKNVIPFNSRYCDDVEYTALFKLFKNVMGTLEPFTKAVFNGVFRNGDNDTLVVSDSSPRSFDGTTRQTWFWWMKNQYGYYLLPTGLNMLVDHSGTDVSKWKVLKIVYNNQSYTTPQALLADYNSKKLQTTILSNSTDWAFRESSGNQRAYENRTPPRVTAVDKPRISVDVDEKYVEWMGWKFYIATTRDTGVSIWDIRFKGNRVVYEVGLQDALASYSGNDPIQASTSYLDRSWGIGSSLYQLLSGYDCPSHGVKLNITTHVASSKVKGNAICVFEGPGDGELPISRHFDHGPTPNFAFYGTTRGQVLTVRSISAVWNYDYVFDYLFYLDGTIEVRAAASGYMQAGFWQKDGSQAAYGTRVHETTMGNVHTHIMNYKVDIDILGTKNSLMDTAITVVKENFPWFDDPITQKKLTRTIIKNESLSAFPVANPDPKSPHVYTIINPTNTNKWGNPRGYRIIPFTNPQYLHLTSDNKRAKLNANWGKYAMAITKRKDTELSSSCTWNQNLPLAPLVDFDKFIDGENIEKEDLVLWINLGMHHVPRAEDVPNTVTTSSRSSFILTPFNYHDDDGIRDIKQAALLVPGKTENDAPVFLESVTPETCLGAVQSGTCKYDGF